jgi:hypothetical protein
MAAHIIPALAFSSFNQWIWDIQRGVYVVGIRYLFMIAPQSPNREIEGHQGIKHTDLQKILQVIGVILERFPSGSMVRRTSFSVIDISGIIDFENTRKVS